MNREELLSQNLWRIVWTTMAFMAAPFVNDHVAAMIDAFAQIARRW